MAHPRLLGALLDLAVEVLATRDGVHLDYMPRMADFAVTGEAVARALGHDVGYFIAAYTDNREELVSTELSADPVAVAVQQLLLQTPGNPSRWLGTPTQLFSVLGGQAQGSVQRSRSWPGSPAALSSRLTRLTPSLRSAGILVETCRTGFARTINLVRL
jgi:hypothetical protein